MALSKNNSYDAKLNQVLEKLRSTNDFDSTLSFKKEIYDDKSNQKNTALFYTKVNIAQPAPYFEGTAVHEGTFKEVAITDFLGKYLVLLFYPLDFTFVCPTEIISFSDNLTKFKRLNTEVIACSTDSKFSHLAWLHTPREEGGIEKVKIPLLSDITHNISKDYGVYSENLGHAYRGLFIIDHQGIVRQITINDLPVGRNVDEILRLVQAFQYTDTHGEVCPAGWEPGDDTMVPETEKAKEFFYKQFT